MVSYPHYLKKMNNMKVHIALVGGQPMPVYIGILAVKPELVWLIHSKNSKEEASVIAKQCGVESEKLELPAVDYPVILEKAKKLLESLDEKEIIINISSGTKPWAVAFALLSVNMPNVSLVYVDQNNKTYDITNKRFLPFNLQMDINTILLYNHSYVQKHINLNKYTNEDKLVLDKVRNLRDFNIKDFNELTIPLEKAKQNALKQNTNFFSTVQSTGSSIVYDKKVNQVEIILNKRNSLVEKAETLASPHVKDIVFIARWFEYMVADMISSWQYQTEIWLNVTFPYQNGTPKNEIDIIVNARNKLLFVECKTQIFDITDIDKFRSAVKNYGGMSSKALFISYTREMKPEAIQKCKDNGIMTFCMGAGNSDKQRKEMLFALLEKEMLNINKR